MSVLIHTVWTANDVVVTSGTTNRDIMTSFIPCIFLPGLPGKCSERAKKNVWKEPEMTSLAVQTVVPRNPRQKQLLKTNMSLVIETQDKIINDFS